MGQSSVRGREATRVMTVHENYPELSAQDLVAEGAETTQHEEVCRVHGFYANVVKILVQI